MQYVIIGSSAAGISAVEGIREKDDKSKIIVISNEKKPLYSRCLLSYLLAGTIDKNKIWYRENSFFKQNNVEAILGVEAKDIDVDKKEILLDNKERLKFDKLLIATGASAKLEKIQGVDKKGVFPLRTIDDAYGIGEILDKVDKAAILGGGLIGLRAAYALNKRGKKVTVFVRSPQILSQISDKISADMIQSHLEKNNIRIQAGKAAVKIEGKTSVRSIILNDDTEVEAQLVIIGKGVAPNIGLAKNAGLKTNWGIVTDNFLNTTNKDIYSAGDACESYDVTLEENSINAIWPVACEQGRTAGLNMTGEKNAYSGTLAMNSLEFFGLPIISIGITNPKKEVHKEIIRLDKKNNIYKKIVLKDNIIVGAICVNSVDKIGVMSSLIKNKIDISSIKDVILEDNFDYGKIVKLIKNNHNSFNQKEFKDTIMTYKEDAACQR